MRNFVDLHTHSAASDGSLSPAGVVELAERRRLAAVALTDHDTVAGLPEARRAARRLAVRFICGVEISAEYVGGALHMLGLGIDPADRALRDLLRRLVHARRQRNPRMITKLRQLGIDITLSEVRALAGGAVVGRLHMAAVLCRKGYVRTVQEAFARYLGYGAPAFVDKERLSPPEAIQGIHAAGGLAVLAHPPQLNYRNLAHLNCTVRDLMAHGLDAIEVYHYDHTPQQTRWYLDLARGLGLLVAGGSDFHGPAKPEARLGRPKVPTLAVEQLLAKLDL